MQFRQDHSYEHHLHPNDFPRAGFTCIRAVQQAGLAYDLLLRPRELPAALRVARAFPDLRLVIDHIAKPDIANPDIANPDIANPDIANPEIANPDILFHRQNREWMPQTIRDTLPYFLGAQGADDLVLLCSDGLWNYATTDAALGGLVSAHLPPPGTPPEALGPPCEHLVDWANGRGGVDNITVTIARVPGEDGADSQREAPE